MLSNARTMKERLRTEELYKSYEPNVAPDAY
jgi:hypothetical protein